MASAHKSLVLAKRNAAYARATWPIECSRSLLVILRELTTRFAFSVPRGDVRLLDGKWYVTHSGLLSLAQRRRCRGIQVDPILQFCDPATLRWVFRAIVYKSADSKGFVGFGDADPSNVSSLVRGAEMRVAETRAVNRALRKAYGIGLCSVEELGVKAPPPKPPERARKSASLQGTTSGNGNRRPLLRDLLCLLIRHHQLDPSLVKAYAAGYCGVPELRQASREQVEAFVKHLAEYASNDRDGLICQLNSHAPHKEDPEEKAAGAA